MHDNASTLRIIPDRLRGQATLDIHRDPGGAHRVWLRMPDLRGFEQLLRGRPGEELSRLASRICGICPWPHHVAATMAVEDALGVTPPPAAVRLREISLLLSAVSDTLLLFHILSGPELQPGSTPRQGDTISLLQSSDIARQALLLRAKLQRTLGSLFPASLYAGSVLVGGLSRNVSSEAARKVHADMAELRQFCLECARRARLKTLRSIPELDALSTPWLALVSGEGGPTPWGGRLRLQEPDGQATDVAPEEFSSLVVEEHAAWTRCAFPRLRREALSLDPDAPRGIYRVGPLARLNVYDAFPTPQAQVLLEEFRQDFGRAPQHTFLYHRARLIELIYCCERVENLLDDPELLSKDIREPFITPCAGEGHAYVEAPRGGLYYNVSLDDDACVIHCDIISPTTQNNAAMNVSLSQAARLAHVSGASEEEILHHLVACLRAYDPCPACATHCLAARPEAWNSGATSLSPLPGEPS